MAGWVTRMTQFLNLWVIRIVVLSSLATHLFLILLAKIRRREAIGWRRTFLWLAYQGASWVATSALGNLTFGRTSREQQLVTFWAPFLLLHLGGPDNISAYSLEDNVLSGRQIFDVIAQLVLAGYGLYTHIYTLGSEGALFWAFVIMYLFGAAKYVEKSFALWKGDLGSIRSSSKKPSGRFTERAGFRRGQELANERALLVAHSLFHISKGAFADYPAKDLVKDVDISGEIFSYGWEEMCKVVKMELSLMYDVLYTKAAVVHTWFGYGIRVASPLATAAAFYLFCLYNKDGQRTGDVVITYLLLVATFLLDLIWLLTALGSTWTYAFLNDRPQSWLHHQLLCSGRWHRFRLFIVSLGLCRLFAKEPTSYRLWTGTIGQYNLLHECTHDTTSQCSRLGKKVASQDSWMEYQYHYSGGLDISKDDVKELLFEWIWEELKKPPPPKPMKKPDPSKLVPLPYPAPWRRKLEDALGFDPAFGERILIWHIATNVFLLCRDQNAACTPQHGEGDQGASSRLPEQYVKAIKALSDYMVFLVVVRPNMVPGLKLRSTYEATRDALEKIWRTSPSSTTREEKLAGILRKMERETSNLNERSLLYDSSIILSDGTQYAEVLLGNEHLHSIGEISEKRLKSLIPELWEYGCVPNAPELLEIIFHAWVRMLVYVSVRCSRDSHGKQLSRGGELTTIVWILVEHAGILGIDKWPYQRDGPSKDDCTVM